MSATTPKNAAAVILLREQSDQQNPEVFWVQRSPKLAFLGGYYAFPGGQFDETDAHVTVENCSNAELATAITCAARELFEELGVLAARGSQTLTKGQLRSLLDDLESGRMSWPQLLSHYDLHLDATDFTYVGRWVTPPFSARRFDTLFFLVSCPGKQSPIVVPGELETGEWIGPLDALNKWQRGDAVAVPPVLHALKTLGKGLSPDLVERFLSIPEAHGKPTRCMEFREHYICFPVRTPTRPPATHTNAYLIYTSEEILVVDPGSPYEDEQLALAKTVDDLMSSGRQVREIVLTHVHPDHVAGVNHLVDHLGGSTIVAAHRLTAEPLRGSVNVSRLIEDDDVITLNGSPEINLSLLHTPGHARGHLCLYDQARGTLLSGDNVVGVGSVLIDPPEGNMRIYLESLRRMRSLPKLSLMLPGHGPAIANPLAKIDEYINHRLEREAAILQAVQDGCTTPQEIVNRVYTDVSPKAHALAERAVIAHLDKLAEDGLIFL